MRRTIALLIFAGGLSAAGCGGAENKMADKPSDQMIAADKAEQKGIEAEERGTPIKKRK